MLALEIKYKGFHLTGLEVKATWRTIKRFIKPERYLTYIIIYFQ